MLDRDVFFRCYPEFDNPHNYQLGYDVHEYFMMEFKEELEKMLEKATGDIGYPSGYGVDIEVIENVIKQIGGSYEVNISDFNESISLC